MTSTSLRAVLGITGAVAGLAYYLLLEEQALATAPASLQRFVVFFALAVFPAFGLLAGPLPTRRAGVLAALLAAAAAALITWAGLRFEVTRTADIFEPTGKGLHIVPFAALTALAVPFLIAAGQAPGGWRDYERLFPEAWKAGVKALIGLLFLALLWMVYFLSDALLSIVGIDVLGDFAETGWGPVILSGAVLGLALAVACELDGVVGTLLGLVLRLLRLLILPVAVVMGVFVIAALIQGLDAVFERLSAAGTMMAMAAGATILAAAVIDATDENASNHRLLIGPVRALGLILPVISAIAIYALWLRVSEYGWTPLRLLAVLSAGIVVLYTIPVSLFAPRARAGWRGRTRQGFVWATLAAMAVGALWFTPVLNAQRIAAQSQIARLTDGRLDPAEYDFWPLAREWGRAGTAALARYKATAAPELLARITQAETGDSDYAVREELRAANRTREWDEARGAIPTVPAGASLPRAEQLDPSALQALNPERLLGDCADLSENGQPQCAAIAANFRLEIDGDEWLIVSRRGAQRYLSVTLLIRAASGWTTGNAIASPRLGTEGDIFDALARGEFDLVAPRVQGLRIRDLTLMPQDTGN